ncbi:LCP family protein [Actinacidiphila glaucinigra]|uniref:LCP family protein n=1 Tax=Actinacidiphila glaucinigra TaxID=235986 RepID=UPI0037F49041
MNDYPRWQYAEGTPEQGGQDPYGEDPYAQQQGDYANGYGREHGQYDPYAQQTGQQQAYQGQQAQQQGQQGYTGQPYYPQEQQQYQQPQQHPQQSQQAQQPQQTQQYQGWIPQQPQYQEPYYEEQQYGQQPPAPPRAPQQAPPAQRRPAYEEPPARPAAPAAPAAPGRAPSGEDGFHTGQFSFVDEETEESEEVIDWLKFTESRTERREEARRRGRNRVVAAVVVLALAAVGGVGYLWKAGKIPGLGGDSGTAQQAAGGQKRDVIVLHLRPVGSEETSTALLVSNSTTKKGTTVLLPNSLAVSGDDGSTTLGKSVVENGSAPTREALEGLLGTKISGTWRLDTPYLDNLVESLGGVLVDTDATVKAGKKKGDKTLVKPGKQQELGGQAAVAYAIHRGPGEGPDKQLARFGQVVQAVLKKMYSDPDLATKTVEGLNQVIEPPLTEKDLGSSLAALSEEAKGGDYTTETLPVEPDGTLSEKATEDVVKKVLGGTVTNTDSEGIPRVTLRNATGVAANTGEAQVQIVGGGYTFVSGAAADTQATSQVLYAEADQKANAEELAKTLGLSAKAAKKGDVASNADITVVLGQDYSPPKRV